MGIPETKQSKTLSVKVSTKQVDGEKTIVFVASSPKEDRDHEAVNVRSLKLPLKGGGYVIADQLTGGENIDIPLLLNHSFDVEDVIGSVRKAYINQMDELVFEAGISGRAKAQDMLMLLEEEHLSNAFSITMFDYDYNMDTQTIVNAEIAEVSLVFRGSNKEARLLAVKSLIKGVSMDKATEELEQPTKEIAETEKVEAPTEVAEPIEIEEVVETPEIVEEIKPIPEAVIAEEIKEEKEMPTEIASKMVKEVPEQAPVVAKAVEMDKYEFAAKQFTAWVSKDFTTLADLNEKALQSYSDYKSKETYMNTGVTADGGAIVPSAQLLAEVYSTLMNYSTVSNDLRVITLTSGNSLDIASLVTDVIMAEISTEGGVKPVTKPVLAQKELTLREFAGIAIITKKLVRQAAVNVYNLLVESFARAIANQRAIMALSDATSGIINTVGVTELEASSAVVTGYTWTDVKKMPYQIAAGAVQGGKYYISRQLLEVLDTAKDLDGKDLDILTLDGTGLSGRFKNGFPFAVEEVLGDASAHAVFGAMGRFGVLLRQGTVESETFDQGTVVDGSAVTHNLIQQNKLAQRVAFYENVGFPIPSAFVTLVPATLS